MKNAHEREEKNAIPKGPKVSKERNSVDALTDMDLKRVNRYQCLDLNE